MPRDAGASDEPRRRRKKMATLAAEPHERDIRSMLAPLLPARHARESADAAMPCRGALDGYGSMLFALGRVALATRPRNAAGPRAARWAAASFFRRQMLASNELGRALAAGRRISAAGAGRWLHWPFLAKSRA